MGQAASAEEVSDGYILAIAAREGHADVVNMYLAKNSALAFHVNVDGSTVVQAASEGGQHDILETLLSSVRVSAASNTFDPVKRLLDQQNSAGRTALSLAATAVSAGHEACVHTLLQAGASVWLPDQAGRTCLHHAAYKGNSTVVELLLDAASQQPQKRTSKESTQVMVHRYVNLSDAAGRTALHYAVHSSDLETIHTLITAGSNLTAAATADSLDAEAPVNQGATPLHIAALKGDQPAAVLILTAYITAAAGALPELEKGPCACTCRQRRSADGDSSEVEPQQCYQECCSRASCDGEVGQQLQDPRSITDAYGLTPYAAAGGHEELRQLLNPHTVIAELLEALPEGPADQAGSRASVLQAAAARTSLGSGEQVALSYRQLKSALTKAGVYLTRQKSLQEEFKGQFQQQQQRQGLQALPSSDMGMSP